ncbi:hypothetical protein CF122_04420 [Aeromonas media]|jgi:hypothetical protein|uniref:Uncharacterized protein n=1 Tax=Aeromonas media TaxID=651 RepID=A0A6M4Y7D1_AERME|nr:hypothetical protein E4184_05730 [Aeromonas media]TNI74615.1 hypothetical protein CF122_04420 [Aeromonas media]
MSKPMPRGHKGPERTLMAINQTITNTESES